MQVLTQQQIRFITKYAADGVQALMQDLQLPSSMRDAVMQVWYPITYGTSYTMPTAAELASFAECDMEEGDA